MRERSVWAPGFTGTDCRTACPSCGLHGLVAHDAPSKEVLSLNLTRNEGMKHECRRSEMGRRRSALLLLEKDPHCYWGLFPAA